MQTKIIKYTIEVSEKIRLNAKIKHISFKVRFTG